VSKWTLGDLAEAALEDERFPVSLDLVLEELPTQQAVDNIKKMRRLGILSGDTLLSLVGQAPIDPIGLMAALLQVLPGKWVFSAIDFSMFRVVSKTPKGEVASALRVDLIQGDVVEALARNKSNQLTLYKSVTLTPGDKDNDKTISELVQDVALAATREGW